MSVSCLYSLRVHSVCVCVWRACNDSNGEFYVSIFHWHSNEMLDFISSAHRTVRVHSTTICTHCVLRGLLHAINAHRTVHFQGFTWLRNGPIIIIKYTANHYTVLLMQHAACSMLQARNETKRNDLNAIVCQGASFSSILFI